MLGESVVEVWCSEVLWRSVGEESWGRLLEKSFGEECCVWRSVGEESWGRLLEKSFGEECCREVFL